MEIIIHGKPNAGSQKSSGNIDKGLVENITGVFFARSGQMHALGETLFVDARFWKGSWYSVYTYTPSANVHEKGSNRNSYFCISIVIKGKYELLISGIYKMLRKVYNNVAVGTYLDGKGKYIVDNLGDDASFTKIEEEINHGFVNLEEDFDSGFQQVFNHDKEFDQCKTYSLDDCDSIAFINDLRVEGRILVKDDKEISKDSSLKGTNEYIEKLKTAEQTIQDKDEEIEQLKNAINAQNEAKHSSKREINKLKDDLTAANNAKETAEANNEKYIEAFNGIASILNNINGGHGYAECGQSQTERKASPTKGRQLHLLNTGLLAVMLIVMVLSLFKGCSASQGHTQEDVSSVIEENKKLKQQLSQKSEELDKLKKAVEQFGYTYEMDIDNEKGDMDQDCGFSIIQGSRYVHAEDVDVTTDVTLFPTRRIDGYNFYCDNLESSEKRKLLNGEPFRLRPSDNNNKEIVISYRSSSQENANPNNKIVFKLN